MKKPKLEKGVEKKLKEIALNYNYLPYFINGRAGSEGVPDTLLITPSGHTLLLEAKLNTKLSPKQRLFFAKSVDTYKVKYSKKLKAIVVEIMEDELELGTFLAVQASIESTWEEERRNFVHKKQKEAVLKQKQAGIKDYLAQKDEY